MDAITGLLAGLREEKPPAERWDPARKGQAETGRFEERS
jgi:1-acyl-sn-glycerol-3-phosphate acyltransferase